MGGKKKIKKLTLVDVNKLFGSLCTAPLAQQARVRVFLHVRSLEGSVLRFVVASGDVHSFFVLLPVRRVPGNQSC
jgi:hypothetical protein